MTLLFIVLSFGLVVFVGAPYLPTLSKQKKDALRLLDLEKGQLLVELGSGDGRMLVEAAKRGIRSVGYEINPILFAISWIVIFRHRSLARVKLASLWRADLSQADGIYIFLHTRFMDRLYKKITREIRSSVKLVSFAFEFRQVKHTTEKSGLFLYTFYNKK